MAITMWVRGEATDDTAEISDVPWAPPDDLLNPVDTPLLVGVDPYGDTVLNHIQITTQLPREIGYLRSRLQDAEQLAMLDELERLAGIATEKVHQYLWFVGD